MLTRYSYLQELCYHNRNLQNNILHKTQLNQLNLTRLEVWANAQRDGRPAEYMWRPLFNAANFG